MTNKEIKNRYNSPQAHEMVNSWNSALLDI